MLAGGRRDADSCRGHAWLFLRLRFCRRKWTVTTLAATSRSPAAGAARIGEPAAGQTGRRQHRSGRRPATEDPATSSACAGRSVAAAESAARGLASAQFQRLGAGCPVCRLLRVHSAGSTTRTGGAGTSSSNAPAVQPVRLAPRQPCTPDRNPGADWFSLISNSSARSNTLDHGWPSLHTTTF